MSNWTLADADRARAEADARDPIVCGTCVITDLATGERHVYRMPADDHEFLAAMMRAALKYGKPPR